MTAVRPARYVGTPVNRVEGYEKVTGAAHCTADTVVPGAVQAVLVGAEVAPGEITVESITESAARARSAPGVLHVLTPLNGPPLSRAIEPWATTR
jgi:xanthine dehydrogenase YagR molybdenum-binding subunit